MCGLYAVCATLVRYLAGFGAVFVLGGTKLGALDLFGRGAFFSILPSFGFVETEDDTPDPDTDPGPDPISPPGSGGDDGGPGSAPGGDEFVPGGY